MHLIESTESCGTHMSFNSNRRWAWDKAGLKLLKLVAWLQPANVQAYWGTFFFFFFISQRWMTWYLHSENLCVLIIYDNYSYYRDEPNFISLLLNFIKYLNMLLVHTDILSTQTVSFSRIPRGAERRFSPPEPLEPGIPQLPPSPVSLGRAEVEYLPSLKPA